MVTINPGTVELLTSHEGVQVVSSPAVDWLNRFILEPLPRLLCLARFKISFRHQDEQAPKIGAGNLSKELKN